MSVHLRHNVGPRARAFTALSDSASWATIVLLLAKAGCLHLGLSLDWCGLTHRRYLELYVRS
jgi:hypothetical protein